MLQPMREIKKAIQNAKVKLYKEMYEKLNNKKTGKSTKNFK